MNTLVKNKILFGRIHEFNMQPQRYIHPSWLEEFMPEVINVRWETCRRTDARAALLLAKRIACPYDYDFIQPAKRIALLYYDELLELCEYAGLALASRELRRSIQNKRLQKFKREFHDDKIRFAHERAQLLTTWSLDDSAMDEFFERPLETARKFGLCCIQEQTDGFGEAVWQRFKYKFPKTTDWGHRLPGDQASAVSSWNLLSRILKTEKSDVWKIIFI